MTLRTIPNLDYMRTANARLWEAFTAVQQNQATLQTATEAAQSAADAAAQSAQSATAASASQSQSSVAADAVFSQAQAGSVAITGTVLTALNAITFTTPAGGPWRLYVSWTAYSDNNFGANTTGSFYISDGSNTFAASQKFLDAGTFDGAAAADFCGVLYGGGVAVTLTLWAYITHNGTMLATDVSGALTAEIKARLEQVA